MNLSAFSTLLAFFLLLLQVGCDEITEAVNNDSTGHSAHTVTEQTTGEMDRIRLPKAAPFDSPVDLRFRPVEEFTYSTNKFMGGSGGPERFVWGYAMKGTVKESDGSLVWRYTIHNRGHDNVLRQCGEVEVVTNASGVVSNSEVIARDADCVSEAMYLDPANLLFPLCCLPENPVSMGTMKRHPEIIEAELRKISELQELSINLGPIGGNHQRIAEGIVERDGQEYLLVREQGGDRVSLKMNNMSGTSAGYHLIDIRTGLTRTAQRLTEINLSDMSERSGPTHVYFRTTESTIYSAGSLDTSINPKVFVELISSCENARMPRQKIDECTRVIADATHLETDPATIEKILAAAYLARGLGHFRQGNLGEAESDLQMVVSKDPNFHAVYHNLGEIKLARQDWSGALVEYDLAIAKSPKDPTPEIKKDIARTHISRGRAYERLGEFAQALEATSKALVFAPGDATAHNNMGFIYLQTGDLKRSVEHYEEAVALDPSDRKARAGLKKVQRRLSQEQ